LKFTEAAPVGGGFLRWGTAAHEPEAKNPAAADCLLRRFG
jgi:hypothetical protein